MTKLVVVILAAYIASCNNQSPSSGFVGGTPKGVSAADAFPEAKVDLEDCVDDEQGITQALLKTKSINNFAPSQYIRYELFVTDCDGNIKDLEGSIAFDVDASVSPFGAPMDYQIFEGSSGQQIGEGRLGSVRGKDLFGNVGDGFGYYATESFNVKAGVQSILLELDVSGMGFTGRNAGVGDTSFLIPTYLAVGSSQSVEQTVEFFNPPPVVE